MSAYKLAISIPSTGTIKSQTVFSLCRMLKGFPYEYTVLFHEGSMLHVMRNRLIQKAIDEKCTHLLFIDSDMMFEKDSAIRLLKRNKDIIGVNYHKRKLPVEAIVQNPKKLQGLTTCDAVGTGFMLIRLDIFKKLEQPWFFWAYADGEPVGEDFWFCAKAREMGYNIYCDMGLKMGHIGDFIY